MLGPMGQQTGTRRPRDLGPAFENQKALFLAGTFAVRREIFRAVGAFASECPSGQHTEFALRLIPYCRRNNLEIAAIDEPTVNVHAHVEGHLRDEISTLLEGHLYILRVHEPQLRKCRRHYSDRCAKAGVYAAKLNRYAIARRLFGQAMLAYPRRLSNLLRFTLTCCPQLGRLAWPLST